jgi:hypothetical protein
VCRHEGQRILSRIYVPLRSRLRKRRQMVVIRSVSRILQVDEGSGDSPELSRYAADSITCRNRRREHVPYSVLDAGSGGRGRSRCGHPRASDHPARGLLEVIVLDPPGRSMAVVIGSDVGRKNSLDRSSDKSVEKRVVGGRDRPSVVGRRRAPTARPVPG